MRRRKAASESSSGEDEPASIGSDSDGEEEVLEGGESEGDEEEKPSRQKVEPPNTIKAPSAAPQDPAKTEDPALVPKVGRFFMHDDRRGRGGGRRFVLLIFL